MAYKIVNSIVDMVPFHPISQTFTSKDFLVPQRGSYPQKVTSRPLRWNFKAELHMTAAAWYAYEIDPENQTAFCTSIKIFVLPYLAHARVHFARWVICNVLEVVTRYVTPTASALPVENDTHHCPDNHLGFDDPWQDSVPALSQKAFQVMAGFGYLDKSEMWVRWELNRALQCIQKAITFFETGFQTLESLRHDCEYALKPLKELLDHAQLQGWKSPATRILYSNMGEAPDDIWNLKTAMDPFVTLDFIHATSCYLKMLIAYSYSEDPDSYKKNFSHSFKVNTLLRQLSSETSLVAGRHFDTVSVEKEVVLKDVSFRRRDVLFHVQVGNVDRHNEEVEEVSDHPISQDAKKRYRAYGLHGEDPIITVVKTDLK